MRLIFHNSRREDGKGFVQFETSAGAENGKPSDPGKAANEGIQRTPLKNGSVDWPHPSL
jgi:hypothetical protein